MLKFTCSLFKEIRRRYPDPKNEYTDYRSTYDASLTDTQDEDDNQNEEGGAKDDDDEDTMDDNWQFIF